MTSAIRLKVVRYQCPHCSRTHSKKAAAEQHIARCWQNPAARACKTCVHFSPESEGPYPQHPPIPEECWAGRKLLSGLHTDCPKWESKTAPCAECTAEIPAGQTYCSTRCRNAADRHDDLDGDL
ncbi:hypothetical protein [Streptomyces antibioticus]|uniref:hypothetical protein n=1 Tax=Streptomyces antibioticus TaxID=1890 RepID=UPI0037022D03